MLTKCEKCVKYFWQNLGSKSHCLDPIFTIFWPSYTVMQQEDTTRRSVRKNIQWDGGAT